MEMRQYFGVKFEKLKVEEKLRIILTEQSLKKTNAETIKSSKKQVLIEEQSETFS